MYFLQKIQIGSQCLSDFEYLSGIPAMNPNPKILAIIAREKRLFYGYFDNHLCESIASDMKIDEVFTSRLDMGLIRELDILFFKIDPVFFRDSLPNCVFIESTEYLISFSLQCEDDPLSIELFLYIECLFESHARLILLSFFICFEFFESCCCYFTSDSSRNETIARLRSRDLDDLSFPPHMGNILEEFDCELVCCHSMKKSSMSI